MQFLQGPATLYVSFLSNSDYGSLKKVHGISWLPFTALKPSPRFYWPFVTVRSPWDLGFKGVSSNGADLNVASMSPLLRVTILFFRIYWNWVLLWPITLVINRANPAFCWLGLHGRYILHYLTSLYQLQRLFTIGVCEVETERTADLTVAFGQSQGGTGENHDYADDI